MALVKNWRGNWGTPDIGFTELISRLRGVPLDPNTGGSQNFGQYSVTPQQQETITGVNTNNNGGINLSRPVYQPEGQVLGDSTVGGFTTGGRTGASTNGIVPDQGVNLAEAIRRANLERIQNIFGAAKQRAGDFRSSGQATFDNLLKSIGAFRERAGTLKANSAQEITDTASGILGSNARSAREAAGQSRALGRAQGLGDSSKFNAQNRVTSSLLGTQGSTLANRGQNERANDALYQERQDQAQSQEDTANTYLKGINDQANAIENTALDQFGEDYGQADLSFASMLNEIQNRNNALSSLQPADASTLTPYANNTSGITNTINGILSNYGGAGSTATADMGANPVSDPRYLEYLKRTRGTYA